MTLREMGLAVLNSNNAAVKADKTMQYARLWNGDSSIEITDGFAEDLRCPDEPARPIATALEDNADDDHHKRIKRILKKNAIEYSIHGIANAESYAIDLFWDLIVRYTHYNLPRTFYDEMVYIANQEAEHFLSWSNRLDDLDCPFGTLPFYDGLWQSAEDTSGKHQVWLRSC
jgi:uncharacterized ferritin-like protein (DUF455 family)